jgi:hypothetical protein
MVETKPMIRLTPIKTNIAKIDIAIHVDFI